jgi:hypothetical protein
MRIERKVIRGREKGTSMCTYERLGTMRTEKSSLRKKERDHCVSKIRTNENREKSHEEEGKRSVCM